MLNKQFVGVSQYFYLFIINLYLFTNRVPTLYCRIFEHNGSILFITTRRKIDIQYNEKINLIDLIEKKI